MHSICCLMGRPSNCLASFHHLAHAQLLGMRGMVRLSQEHHCLGLLLALLLLQVCEPKATGQLQALPVQVQSQEYRVSQYQDR